MGAGEPSVWVYLGASLIAAVLVRVWLKSTEPEVRDSPGHPLSAREAREILERRRFTDREVYLIGQLVTLSLAFLHGFWLMPRIRKVPVRRRAECVRNLRDNIGPALLKYVDDHDGCFPDELSALVEQGYLTDPDVLTGCPRSWLRSLRSRRGSEYLYFGKGLTRSDCHELPTLPTLPFWSPASQLPPLGPAGVIILSDRPGNHAEHMVALFGDGNVAAMPVRGDRGLEDLAARRHPIRVTRSTEFGPSDFGGFVPGHSNLCQLHGACRGYAEHPGARGLFPRQLAGLLRHRLVPRTGILTCPADQSPDAAPDGIELSYVSAFDGTDKRLTKDFPGDAVMVWEREPFYGEERRAVLFDGSLRHMGEPEFGAALEQLDGLVARFGREDVSAGTSIAQYVEDIRSGDQSAREVAAFELAGREQEAVPALIDAMVGASPAGRDTIGSILAGAGGADVARGLVSLLRRHGSDAELQPKVHKLLHDIAPTAVPTLVSALENGDVVVRRNVACALASAKDGTPVPALTEALKDADSEVRTNAARALRAINTAEARAGLVDALVSGDASLRGTVLMELAALENMLVSVNGKRHLKTRWPSSAPVSLSEGLKESLLANEGAAEALIEALGDKNQARARIATRLLGGVADSSAIPRLQRAAQLASRRREFSLASDIRAAVRQIGDR